MCIILIFFNENLAKYYSVSQLWFVDPADRTPEAFELHGSQWLMVANAKDDGPTNIRPFNVVTFGLADLWSRKARTQLLSGFCG